MQEPQLPLKPSQLQLPVLLVMVLPLQQWRLAAVLPVAALTPMRQQW
jgi:hypothetical protein